MGNKEDCIGMPLYDNIHDTFIIEYQQFFSLPLTQNRIISFFQWYVRNKIY